MISSNDFRPGVTVEIDGNVWQVVDSNTLNQVKVLHSCVQKMKNLQTGSVVERTFNAGEKVPKAHVDRRRMQYLYEADGAYTFMDNETYDQVELNVEQLGDAKNFLLENMEVSIMFFQGIVIGIDLPVAVELRVVETDPGIRGDTATGGNKPAVLETGYTVKVPLFIEVDDVLRIDTRTGQYIERA